MSDNINNYNISNSGVSCSKSISDLNAHQSLTLYEKSFSLSNIEWEKNLFEPEHISVESDKIPVDTDGLSVESEVLPVKSELPVEPEVLSVKLECSVEPEDLPSESEEISGDLEQIHIKQEIKNEVLEEIPGEIPFKSGEISADREEIIERKNNSKESREIHVEHSDTDKSCSTTFKRKLKSNKKYKNNFEYTTLNDLPNKKFKIKMPMGKKFKSKLDNLEMDKENVSEDEMLMNNIDERICERKLPKKVESKSPEMVATTSKVTTVRSTRKNYDLEELKAPLLAGWRRLTVTRGIQSKMGKKADVYYFSPCGKKFRSGKDIERFLEKSPSPQFIVDNFSFALILIGLGEPYEKERNAFIHNQKAKQGGRKVKIIIHEELLDEDDEDESI